MLAVPVSTRGRAGNSPATVKVLDLSTNEPCYLIVNDQIAAAFRAAGSPLVGRYFQLRGETIFDGGRHRDIDVVEMEANSDNGA